MGKTEKIVVLGVLFLIVLILVVSLDPGTDAVLAGSQDAEVALGQPQNLDPGVAGPERVSSESSGAPRGVQPAGDVLGAVPPPVAAPFTLDRRPGQDPEQDPLLDPGQAPGAGRLGTDARPAARPRLLLGETRPIYAVPETPPDDWALRSLAGLSDHRFDPTLKVYTVQGGETFESLAERYYEKATLASLLARNNEGVERLRAGMQILIPIHDDGIDDERLYVVQQDDSLWKIAKKVYGQGSLWDQIFAANQDVLVDADAVKPGMQLVIPR